MSFENKINKNFKRHLNPYQEEKAVTKKERRKPVICSSSSQAFFLLKPYISSQVEEFWVIALGPSHHVLGIRKLFKGTVDSCFFHPRDLFRALIEKNASCFIVAHNHPSSLLKPSKEDIDVTLRILKGSHILGFHFLDHLILSVESYCSLASLGYLSKKKITSQLQSPSKPLT